MQFEVTVRDVVEETADTVTLVFDAGDDVPPYQAGQFLSIDPHQFEGLAARIAELEQLKGRREPVRAYSLASAPGEQLAITIKEDPFVPGVTLHAPLLSPFLVYRSSLNARLRVFGFAGKYVLPPDVEQRAEQLLHVVAGSGVVPNWSILKHALRTLPRMRHVFVDVNKTWDDVIFRDALAAVAAAHPERVRLVHTLTRQRALPSGVRAGRVTAELLAEVAPPPARSLAYVCGPAITPWARKAALQAGVHAPPRFLESTLGILSQLGFPPDRIRRESWG